MRKLFAITLFGILLTSCGGLTKTTSSIETNDYGKPLGAIGPDDIVGLTPVEVKQKFGPETIFEGFTKERSYYGNQFNKGVFVLVYNRKPNQMRASFNLDKRKQCIFIPFGNDSDFKFRKVVAGKFVAMDFNRCSYEYFNKKNFKEMSAEALMKKFNGQ